MSQMVFLVDITKSQSSRICRSVGLNRQNFILSDKIFYFVRQMSGKNTKITMIMYRTVLQNWVLSC